MAIRDKWVKKFQMQTVGQLIAELQKHDPNLPVVVTTHYDNDTEWGSVWTVQEAEATILDDENAPDQIWWQGGDSADGDKVTDVLVIGAYEY